MFKRLIAGALVFGMAAMAPPAHAQVSCAARSDIVTWLTRDHAEKLNAIGMKTDHQLVEIWSSDKTGTWTILLSKADGVSCIIAGGTHFEASFPEVEAKLGPAS